MKICFYNVTASLTLGGLETYIWELGRELVIRGHDVTVVTGSGGQTRQSEIHMVEFPFTPRQSFPNLPNFSPGFRGRYKKLCERMSFARNAVPFLKGSEFDVIVVQKPFDFPVLWWARRDGLEAQTVFSSGGEDFFAGDRLFRSAIDHWVACSQSNVQQINSRYKRPVRVTYYGVDTELFRPMGRDTSWRSRYGIPVDAMLALSVGRLVRWKGLQIVIEALTELHTVHFAVVGEGSYQERLIELAATFGIEERIHFVGPVRHSRSAQYIFYGGRIRATVGQLRGVWNNDDRSHGMRLTGAGI